MKGGRKAMPPSILAARGTSQPCRTDGRTEMVEPNSLPQQPEWLTEEGREVWLDEIGRLSGSRMGTEWDSTQFANYCNLQGRINLAWRTGAPVAMSALMESRRRAEQFGLFGTKSRVKGTGDGQKIKTIFSGHGTREI